MKQAFLDRGFQIHLIVYAAVNILLVAIDLLAGPDKYWFYWPLGGWGLGIIAHGVAVHFGAKHRPNSTSDQG